VKPDGITLTAKMKNELKALKHRKVDLSDQTSPEITAWEKTVSGKFYRPIKKQITIRIDADLLDWFKHATNKYQSLINQACREYMIQHEKPQKNIKRKHG
jgi:uncharacterized protein (DUF4415 family)